MVCYTSIAACFRALGAVVWAGGIVQGVPQWPADGGLTSRISVNF